MLARTITHALVGLDSRRVEVEAHLQEGAPAFVLVGLPDRACQEAKQRVRSGIASAELRWPGGRIVLNLAPAELRKEGPGFDLPIALSILAASRQVPGDALRGHGAVGELALDGRVRAVPGVLAAAEGARRHGLTRILCAASSAAEAALAGVEVVPLHHLAEAVSYLRGEWQPRQPDPVGELPEVDLPDLCDVRGQERARRALEIAAAGAHNVLFGGPPGIGKSMLAHRLPGILPSLTREESLEVTRIHSVAGLLEPGRPLITAPPFRRPHHGSSAAAIVGGGSGPPRLGDATLAHRGVLFLDELAEFQRPTLEALRAPLEDGIVSIARIGGRAVFPARFQLVGAMNLCPCGARGDPAVECTCSPQRLASYRDKLSRALLDRFDLVVTVPRPRAVELAGAPSEASAVVRSRVVAARERLRAERLERTPSADELLTRAVERLPLSGRGRARVARVARTIAALAGSGRVEPEHVAEALAYRSPTELAAAA